MACWLLTGPSPDRSPCGVSLDGTMVVSCNQSIKAVAATTAQRNCGSNASRLKERSSVCTGTFCPALVCPGSSASGRSLGWFSAGAREELRRRSRIERLAAKTAESMPLSTHPAADPPAPPKLTDMDGAAAGVKNGGAVETSTKTTASGNAQQVDPVPPPPSASQTKGDAADKIEASAPWATPAPPAAQSAGSLVPAASEKYQWMPTLKDSSPSRECVRRVRNDIRSLMKEPVPGLFVYPDEDLVTVVHALVTGPFDTPYEGGFFYFVMHCPDDYPQSPPRVRLMTTGGGSVRFNPNLYQNGKVCLSILGTWSGPRWTPVQSISSVLLSIQSLMCDKPYHNEPGHEKASNPRDVRDYNDCIMHETLRVAVCSMAGDTSLWRSMPACFQNLTRELFLSFMPRYELVCEQNMHRDGGRMMDPFGQNKGVFRYAAILRSIRQIAKMVSAHDGDEPASGSSSSHEAGDGLSTGVIGSKVAISGRGTGEEAGADGDAKTSSPVAPESGVATRSDGVR